MRFLFRPEFEAKRAYGEYGDLLPTPLGVLEGLETSEKAQISAFLVSKSKIYSRKITTFEPMWIFKCQDLDVEGCFEYFVVGKPTKSELSSRELGAYYRNIERFLHKNYLITSSGDSKYANKLLKSFIIE